MESSLPYKTVAVIICTVKMKTLCSRQYCGGDNTVAIKILLLGDSFTPLKLQYKQSPRLLRVKWYYSPTNYARASTVLFYFRYVYLI